MEEKVTSSVRKVNSMGPRDKKAVSNDDEDQEEAGNDDDQFENSGQAYQADLDEVYGEASPEAEQDEQEEPDER